MWYNRTKCLFSLSFIYLFVSLFAHASVRAYRVHVFKKNEKKKKKKKKKTQKPPKKQVICGSIGRQKGFFLFVFVFCFFCKDLAQTVWMHMHMLIWNLGKRELILVLYVRLFDLLVWFCRFPLPLGVWEGLRFVIVAFPGLFSYLFFQW